MADSKASALAAFTDLSDADLFYAVDGSTSKKITWASVKAEILAEIVAGKQGIPIPASAMLPRTTNGPPVVIEETATNKVMTYSLGFDAAVDEYAQFSIEMPKSWDEGTISAIFYWSHGATTTNFDVVWGMHALAVSNDDTFDGAISTGGVEVTDTGGTTGDLYISSETAALTVTGTPAENDMLIIQVYRYATNVADTMAVDAKLHGIKLFITTNAGTDA